MPNHVRNVVRIKGIKTEEERDYLLRKLAVKYHDSYTDKDQLIMDFDLIIPEPRFKKDCPKDCLVNKDSHVQEVEGRPWFNWYNFHCEYWGTKWNAYDGYTTIKPHQIIFVFSTAWSAPFKIYEKLTELGYDLDIRYADEDIGSNCGRITWEASEHKLMHYPEAELTDPDRFAEYTWHHY